MIGFLLMLVMRAATQKRTCVSRKASHVLLLGRLKPVIGESHVEYEGRMRSSLVFVANKFYCVDTLRLHEHILVLTL